MEKIKAICPECGLEREILNKERVSEAQIRKTCRSCVNKGKVLSDDIRKKLSDSLKGKILSSDEAILNRMLPYQSSASRDIITINCDFCQREFEQYKENVMRNMKRNNGQFLCHSCAFTEEGKQRISEATSYTRSEETKQKMKEAAKKKWDSPEGKELKDYLSRCTAKQQNEFGPYLKHRRSKYLITKKAGTICVGSSYEIRASMLLDEDKNVQSYECQNYFVTSENRGRRLDFLVTFIDGCKKVIEVKPKRRLSEINIEQQIADNKNYAESNGYGFEIWTEEELGFQSEKDLTIWADGYLSQIDGVDYTKIRKERNVEKVKRYYRKHLADDRLDVHCEYCNETHNIRRQQYEINLEKNGRYICHKENAVLMGKTNGVKQRKENPHAAEGNKQCVLCKEVKPFEQFGKDKSRRDGYASRCLICRARIATEKYQQSKTNDDPHMKLSVKNLFSS